jgi:hypothetical protein
MTPRLRPAHLRYATRPATWRHLARRAGWEARRSADDQEPSPLSWPLDPALGTRLRLRWPAQYGWPNAAGWIEPIRRGLGAHVRLESAEIAQPLGNVVLLEAVAGGRRARVVIDYDDQLVLNESADDADLYFKLQYRRGGYGTGHIRPGGYVSKQPALYRHARRWRALRAHTAPHHDVLGRFGTSFQQDIRHQAIALLQGQSGFEFYGGTGPVWWGEYMDEMATARVCVDLPGRGELCYRLVEYLAVGACVVGPELRAQLHVDPEPGVHLMRVPRSLDGLLECCQRLLGDEQLRRHLQAGAADFFDRYLALEQLGAYYASTIWTALAEG